MIAFIMVALHLRTLCIFNRERKYHFKKSSEQLRLDLKKYACHETGCFGFRFHN